MYPPDLPLFISTPDPNSNSYSRLEELLHLASSSFCFPSSPYTLECSEDHFLNGLTWEQLLLTDHHQTMMHEAEQDAVAPKQGLVMMPGDEPSNATRKRPMKKDRHSKITTAKGPRDRRMRLSLEVARKFFDLQDALGYDKASKTVEWLLIQANSAIDETLQGYTTAAASVSSTHSECEVVSGIDDASATATVNDSKKSSKKKAKVVSVKRTRESRMEARERARKRTLARKSVDLKQCPEGGCWGQWCAAVEEQRDYGGGDDISVITRNWNSCCIYQQDDAPRVNELEYCGKAWEAYNNI